MDVLRQEQVRAFAREGFLIVRGVFEAEQVATLSSWVEELAALPETPGRHMMYFETSQLEPDRRILSRMENFYPYHAGFAGLIDGERLRGAVGQLFGVPAVLFKDKINFKLPGGAGFKPHQDVQAGWGRYASLHVSALVCIDEATVDNGCLELVSGLHRHGLIGSMWEPLNEPEVRNLQFEPTPTRPGDVVFFDSYAPHASGPNLSQTRRRLLYVTYNKASEGDQRERYYADKRASYPPDIEREAGKRYLFRV